MEPFGDLEKEAAPDNRPLGSTDYDPDKLLDALLDRLKLKNDAVLARALGTSLPVLSKIRHRQLPIGPAMLLRMHEKSGLSVQALRQLMEVRQEPPPLPPLALPSWFPSAFGHLGQDDIDIAVRLWQEEPGLRRLTQALEVLLPDRRRLLDCPHCGHSAIQCLGERHGIKRYVCSACESYFTAAEGTPFHDLSIASHPRLFAAAVTLWGPWTPFYAFRIAGCSDPRLLASYIRRLRPLLDELDPASLFSRPAYRFGFTPAQQGIRCLRCDSTELAYAGRTDPDNPSFRCTGCRYKFHLKASFRKQLPIPADVRCPKCSSTHLAVLHRAESRYQCKDCRRTFCSAPKTLPAKDDIPLPLLSTASVPTDAKGAAMLVWPDGNLDPLPGNVHYTPANLLDTLLDKMQLQNDVALAHALGVTPPVISKIRQCQKPIGAALLLRMHEQSGLSVQELRQLMGDPRETFFLPFWFRPAFGHLGQDDFNTALRLWRTEPALRRLTNALEALLPTRRRVVACIRCHHPKIRVLAGNEHGIRRYVCSACGADFMASEGTPFSFLHVTSYPRLFATAVTLWGSWTPFVAWKIVGCDDTQFAEYIERIRPLLDKLAPDPLVTRPAYRLGITPAQQGIRCLRCDSTDLTYADRSNPDNPRFRCTGCSYKFHLKASFRRRLPLPDGLCCPRCGSDNLLRGRSAAINKGRSVYFCKGCARSFTVSPKTQPPSTAADDSPNTTHAVTNAGSLA